MKAVRKAYLAALVVLVLAGLIGCVVGLYIDVPFVEGNPWYGLIVAYTAAAVAMLYQGRFIQIVLLAISAGGAALLYADHFYWQIEFLGFIAMIVCFLPLLCFTLDLLPWDRLEEATSHCDYPEQYGSYDSYDSRRYKDGYHGSSESGFRSPKPW